MNFRIFIVIFLTLSEADGKVTNTYEKKHNLIMTIALIYSHQQQKQFFEFMV